MLSINFSNDSIRNNGVQWAIQGITPWIIDNVEEKIQTAQANTPIHSLCIGVLEAKSWVANQFIDLLLCQDISENGLEKLTLNNFHQNCEPFEDEVM